MDKHSIDTEWMRRRYLDEKSIFCLDN